MVLMKYFIKNIYKASLYGLGTWNTKKSVIHMKMLLKIFHVILSDHKNMNVQSLLSNSRNNHKN